MHSHFNKELKNLNYNRGRSHNQTRIIWMLFPKIKWTQNVRSLHESSSCSKDGPTNSHFLIFSFCNKSNTTLIRECHSCNFGYLLWSGITSIFVLCNHDLCFFLCVCNYKYLWLLHMKLTDFLLNAGCRPGHTTIHSQVNRFLPPPM